MATLTHVRLLKPYRGYRSGQAVSVTRALAAQLVESGTAVVESQRPLDGLVVAERAVAAPVAETR